MSEIEGNSVISPKRRKVEASDHEDDENTSKEKNCKFAGFQLTNVLNENSQRKMICVEGKFGDKEEKAVVVVEKIPITEEAVKNILTDQSRADVILENDIYGTYHLYPVPELNAVKSTLIYPATEKHIAKYTAQEMFLIQESQEDYQQITLPYLNSEKFSIQWVYNILAKKTESERIVFEDPDPEKGFILLPDMKWNGEQVEDLYLVAIVHKHGIRSIRDLGAEHLPLLNNILKHGQDAIQKKYSVPPSKLRIYFHYQPSYYHLHLHFTHLRYDAPGSGVEKAHLLSDVIENISMDQDFYQKKTLSFTVKKSETLYKKYQEAGKL